MKYAITIYPSFTNEAKELLKGAPHQIEWIKPSVFTIECSDVEIDDFTDRLFDFGISHSCEEFAGSRYNLLFIDLGFIENVADKLQAMFEGYSEEPNEYGRYLKFNNYSDLVINKGVTVETNCFESEEHFREQLMNKFLFSLSK